MRNESVSLGSKFSFINSKFLFIKRVLRSSDEKTYKCHTVILFIVKLKNVALLQQCEKYRKKQFSTVLLNSKRIRIDFGHHQFCLPLMKIFILTKREAGLIRIGRRISKIVILFQKRILSQSVLYDAA